MSEQALLSAILSELQMANRHNAELWSIKDIAAFIRLSKSSVQARIINTDGFPKPVILPTGSKRWYAKDARAWAHKYKVG